MATLVAASSALQRERTALRVMLQLLVDRRDELTVGDLVSVGDLFDVLAQGDEPFSDDLKRHFDHARDVYRDQFRPMLLDDARPHATRRPTRPTPKHPFRADDRLVKTLLLAALVPQARPAAQPRRRKAHRPEPRVDRVPDPGRREGHRARPSSTRGRRRSAR